MWESITDADISRWIGTPVRYAIIAVAVVMCARMTRDAASQVVEGTPRRRESFSHAAISTAICWVVGNAAGPLIMVWYSESGPLWHRFFAGVVATYIGGLFGYSEGIRLWKAKHRPE